jgi:hypothetical protein
MAHLPPTDKKRKTLQTGIAVNKSFKKFIFSNVVKFGVEFLCGSALL